MWKNRPCDWEINFNEPAMVITLNGISARLYGPWNRAEHKGTMNFINMAELSRRQQVEVETMYRNEDVGQLTEKKYKALGSPLTEVCDKRRSLTNMEYCNAVERCQELAALKLTIEKQELGSAEKFQAIVVDMLRNPNFDLQQLIGWASNLL